MHPVDTLKAKLQVKSFQKERPASFGDMMSRGAIVRALQRNSLILQVARETVSKESVGGLYRGFAIHVLGSVPAGFLYFGSYEFFKRHSLKYQYLQTHPFISYLLGGLFAETVACTIFVPVDVIKERRQVQSNLKTFAYRSDLDAIRQVLHSEGVRGLYRAYAATVMSFGPFSAFYFLFYEKLKGLFVSNDVHTYLRKVERRDAASLKASQSQDIGFF